MTARFSLQGVTKRFGETLANVAISLEVMPGEIVVVLGETAA
jgi:general nucleoside transport system ATP-binding protein